MLSRAMFRVAIAGGLALVGGAAVLNPEPAQAQLVIELVANDPPPRIESYPRSRYEDHDVYFVHGRWYYQRGPHWYYYDREPRRLRYHREHVLERSPYRRPYSVYRQPRGHAGYRHAEYRGRPGGRGYEPRRYEDRRHEDRRHDDRRHGDRDVGVREGHHRH
jgi:hypothetical protein